MEQAARRDVIGVFENDATAQRAADVAGRIVGQQQVRVGERPDERAALRSEMQEEMAHTIAGPGNVGPFTKEMTKGLALGTAALTALGVLVALPFGFIDFGPPVWQRFVIAAFVGGVAGATLGFTVGGGWGAKGPAEPLGAERGVVVAASVAAGEEADRVASALAALHPIRLDVLDEAGRRIETVTEEHRGDGVVQQVGDALRQEGDWDTARHQRR
jgi:hypothetical protein